MKIEDRLKITRTTYYNGFDAMRLNMPIRDLYDAVGATGLDFYDKLVEHGIKFDAPVVASEQDLADYKEVDARYSRISETDGPATPEENYLHGLVNVLINLVYYDTESTDETTGKHGLADCNGKVVVPAWFDSCRGCREMSECDSLAVVEKGGEFYLTPRDGSGRLLNRIPYTSIGRSLTHGWVKRGEKCGLIDIKSGRTIVPCEMDWMEDTCLGFRILFGRKGQIGLYDNYLSKYISPRFSAFDFATKQFRRNGQWGWVRRSGRFTKIAPGHIYDVMTIGIDAESILDLHDKPRKKREKQYYTPEEMDVELKSKKADIEAVRNRTLKSYLNLPKLEIPEDVTVDERLLAMLNHAVSQLENGEKYEATILVTADSEPDAPEMHIKAERKDRMVTDIEVSWRPRNKKTTWRDVQFEAIKSFHQIAFSGENGIDLKFQLNFKPNETETIVRFVAYYYLYVWHLKATQLDFGRCEVTWLKNAAGETEAKMLPLDDSFKAIIPEGYQPVQCTPAEQVFEEIEDMYPELIQADDPQAEARRRLEELKSKQKR